MKKLLFFLLILCASGTLNAQTPVAEWGPFGIVVGDAPGNTPQINPRMAESTNEAYFFVWEDLRNGSTDIYLQKIDRNGELMFEPQGIPVCKMSEDQNDPRIISDGAGGAIIVWQDNRRGSFDIYAQRVDRDGNPLWLKDGIPVCEAPEGQFFPEAVGDGAGGAIVVWHDYRNGSEDIYAQRIDAQGRVLFANQGAPICVAEGTQWFPMLVSDGQNGAIITWMDRRSGNFDVYAQRLDYSGKTLWMENGVVVCAADGNQENIEITDNGAAGAIIGWRDSRPEASGAYVQKVNLEGATLLNVNGVMIAQETGAVSSLGLARTVQGGAVIVWSDSHAGDPDVYMQVMDPVGRMSWLGGVPLAKLRGVQENPKIFVNGPNFFVVWEDKRKGAAQLYGQKVKENGEMILPEGGILLSDSGVNPQLGAVAVSDSGNITYVYQDRKKGNYDIYVGHILRNNQIDWMGIINNTPGEVVQDDLDMTLADQGVVFAFKDFRNGFSNIYLQKISKNGKKLWQQDGVPAAAGMFNQRDPRMISDGAGGAIVVWEDYRDRVGPRIFAQKIGAGGSALWTISGVSLAPKASSIEQIKPKVVEDGSGGAIVVYVDYRSNLNYQDIYAQRINGHGVILWGGEGKVVSSGNGNQDDPVIAPDPLFVAWTDYRNGDRNSDIYAQKLDLSGKTLLKDDGIPVCEAPDSQRSPSIINTGSRGVIIAWTDKGGGSFDIFVQKFDASGRSEFTKDGIPVCQAARTQQNPIMLRSDNSTMFFWEDFRYGNWDIFVQKLSDQGQLMLTEEGVVVSCASNTQYAPFAAAFENMSLLAWEDYRNGKNYSIYLQKLTNGGSSLFEENGYPVLETAMGGRAPRLVVMPDKSVVLGWEDYRYGRRAIYAQRFTF